MHNSTFSYNATVTCTHCTAPRRMDGQRYEPVRIMTHYESDFGAAPKVEIPLGQTMCAISPEYAPRRWVGIKAIVRDNPCFAICRSQHDNNLYYVAQVADLRDMRVNLARSGAPARRDHFDG